MFFRYLAFKPDCGGKRLASWGPRWGGGLASWRLTRCLQMSDCDLRLRCFSSEVNRCRSVQVAGRRCSGGTVFTPRALLGSVMLLLLCICWECVCEAPFPPTPPPNCLSLVLHHLFSSVLGWSDGKRRGEAGGGGGASLQWTDQAGSKVVCHGSILCFHNANR